MSPSYLFIVFIALCAFTHVLGDLYMQNPRGNNDRLNEDGDRDNANRLFDSQNNAQGGYCWGPELTYIEGSQLSVEWTNQHSCGTANTACQLVAQYMCTSDAAGADVTQIIRDGTTTTTITTGTTATAGAAYYNAKNADGTFTYGMNEDIANYQTCLARARNNQLFTADQNVVNNQGSMATRQNPTGTRYGFECTEENDYYPYWHPSPWKDIAILTNDATPAQCAYYQSQSQNVLAKNYCQGTTTAQQAANNAASCATAQGVWAETAAFGIPPPDCLAAAASRDNHLGNGADGNTLSYNWTLPTSDVEPCIDTGNCTCVLRLRYNITLGELNGTEDVSQNKAVTDDPNLPTPDGTLYTLAIDTAQTGRTFQDRSFMFRIMPRPDSVPATANIYNLNVRGKRGNIVQTYPATEYDYVPTHLEVNQDDVVHFQWTGCDTNPADNAGEGQDSTDRSNIVQIANSGANVPFLGPFTNDTPALFPNPAQATRFANIDQNPKACKTLQQLTAAANNGGAAVDQSTGNCMLLNQAKARFSGAVVPMNTAGTFAFMSTRNNNFSNRSQKGTIKVKSPSTGATIVQLSPAQTSGVVIGVVAAVAVGALVGTIVYAKRNPHSGAGAIVSKIPGLNRI